MAPLIIPLALAAIGTAAYEVAAQPSAPTAPTQTQTATEQAAAANAAAHAQATALSKRRGMASTVLQNPLTAGGAASTQHATLGI